MKDILIKFRNKEKYDFSCSETILHAANEYYNLGLTEKSFKMIAPFSGGMMEQETCGILTASLTVLGILFTNDVAHTSNLLKEATIDFKHRFKLKFGSHVCNTLITTLRDEVEGCTDFIIEGGLLLKEVIDKYEKQI